MKRLAISLFSAVALGAVSAAAGWAAPPSVTGTWSIQQNGANGNGFTGTFVNDTQINGKWHGPGGAGWLTVYVSPNGHSFNGTWGYNGRAANGSFVGNKVLPPSPITAAGKWNVTGAGGPNAFVGA